MTSEKDETSVCRSQVLEEDTRPAHVGIHVTADICVIHNDSSQFSGDSEDPKVTIVTSLNAVFKGNSILQDEILSVIDSEESYTVSKEPSLLEDVPEQPFIRRSKKCTQLNNSFNFKYYDVNERAQIDRKILLPYLGCSTKNEIYSIESSKTPTKSSKSWENIRIAYSNKRNPRPTRSQSLCKPPPVDQHFKYLTFNDSLFSFKERELPNVNINTLNNPQTRRFYCIKDSLPDTQILFQDEKKIKYQCTPIDQKMNSNSTEYLEPEKFPHQSFLHDYINGFDQEIMDQSVGFRPKATRNVSILHRPRTRSKATSTTSLNKEIYMEQSINNSIKGLLMPYISSGKDFPSELVLKLVPKKDAPENKSDIENANGEMKTDSIHSSGTNLLAPIINTSPSLKKKKGNIFTKWFSKSKKKNDDINGFTNNSDDNMNKEVYYPSIVEVYNNKKGNKLNKPVGSTIDTINSSFFFERRKNK